MEGLIRYIVHSLVEFPEEVSVIQIPGADSQTIELRVSPKDIGKVIGKNGRIAKSLRTILTAAATKEGKHYTLEIID